MPVSGFSVLRGSESEAGSGSSFPLDVGPEVDSRGQCQVFGSRLLPLQIVLGLKNVGVLSGRCCF